jgi:hypothetical protein
MPVSNRLEYLIDLGLAIRPHASHVAERKRDRNGATNSASRNQRGSSPSLRCRRLNNKNVSPFLCLHYCTVHSTGPLIDG